MNVHVNESGNDREGALIVATRYCGNGDLLAAAHCRDLLAFHQNYRIIDFLLRCKSATRENGLRSHGE